MITKATIIVMTERECYYKDRRCSVLTYSYTIIHNIWKAIRIDGSINVGAILSKASLKSANMS